MGLKHAVAALSGVSLLYGEMALAADTPDYRNALTFGWLPILGLSVRWDYAFVPGCALLVDSGTQLAPSVPAGVLAEFVFRAKVGLDIHPISAARGVYIGPRFAANRLDLLESERAADWYAVPSLVAGYRFATQSGFLLQLGAGASAFVPIADAKPVEPVNPVVELRLGKGW